MPGGGFWMCDPGRAELFSSGLAGQQRGQGLGQFLHLERGADEALLATIRSRDVKIWESPLGGWPPPERAG